MNVIKRIFVEKKQGFDIEAQSLLVSFQKILKIEDLNKVRILYRYDMEDVAEDVFGQVVSTILSEPNVDQVSEASISIGEKDMVFAIAYLPGQYDQHADSAVQCVQILSGNRPLIKVAKIVVLQGVISQEAFNRIKKYMINPVDSEETTLENFVSLGDIIREPDDISFLESFIELSPSDLEKLRIAQGFAMANEDIVFVQEYFKTDEERNPTITELKVIDTYWSDHCRHTTFQTHIKKVSFNGADPLSREIGLAYEEYRDSRLEVYGENTDRPMSLMDLAVIGTKVLKKRDLIQDLDESEEINACSIEMTVDHDGVDEEWLLMFKNETHNHPTEIEPFGGAATCLGGAIRDPLSGRSYVYQAMRVTGAWDPRVPIEDTIPGKLPQRKISTEAAHGYSSYGNQIGLATGQVVEVYDPGFLAKRMEVGAVIAAAPKENVRRERPTPGDVVLLVGGRTGRDGCGGATGSSKAHTEESIKKSGAEVQKGNPVEERKIQRLFRNKELALLIKRCNDFGAGGVSVAIGELADSLEINLDKVPKKYEGLDGTELAISESQERMAVVVEPKDVETFIEMGNAENLEVTPVALVTDTGRLIMKWRGAEILNLSRHFLDTNGAPQFTEIVIEEPHQQTVSLEMNKVTIGEKLFETLKDLNVASQRGLAEMFDSTIGAGTVTMPYGGKNALSPMDGMVAKIPMIHGDTTTCSMMTFGYNPGIAKESPFLGGMMSVIESLSKLVALGGNYKKARLSFQEYFERLGKDPVKWGRPFAALLGAHRVQKAMGTPAIGGKDSMSGTFEELTVPPTLISFAVTTGNIHQILTSDLKTEKSILQLFELPMGDNGIPDLDGIKDLYEIIQAHAKDGHVLSAKTIGLGGIAVAMTKMAFGNGIGITLVSDMDQEYLFAPLFGSILVESKTILDGATIVGITNCKGKIISNKEEIDLSDLAEAWEAPLREVYPQKADVTGTVETLSYTNPNPKKSSPMFRKPQVFIPVFPGTNCEYDSAKAFENAGGKPVTTIFRNQSVQAITESIDDMVKHITESQIIMIPGGFSAGDQPDGSGKFIASVFRNPRMMDAVMDLINNRDGLVLGICNGFQALIKLGLVPNGEICDITADMPTLTFNTIGRHISTIPMTRIASTISPWLVNTQVGDIHRIPMSHGEGRFVASDAVLKNLIENGQIATQYVDFEGKATLNGAFNPNGSVMAVEGITSLDGRIFGKMGHSERIGKGLYKNIPGNMDQEIFKAGVDYFK
ncbi:phosphoribosylformylglycinamidine synthase [Acetobacterium bakii]|uniref:Phosphoribosylformylglycinamidine synthase n=1 Tax=Acetobacterium bakii TaxID=52689 RepID=A0A0L6TVU1_9FIRM|nr:phosphoribosylformylglycinamidine synthase [Acetobacterium bakii]